MSRPPLRTGCVLAAMACAVGITACSAVGPDYQPPPLESPDRFLTEGEPAFRSDAADLAAWWARLEDETLNDLASRTLESNLDLRSALSRVTEAAAIRGVARADLVPRVDFTGDASRSQNSEETAFGRFGPRASDLYAVSLASSWEIDLWGRIRRSVEAANADLDASLEDARSVLVSVLAETVATYVDLRIVQQRVGIARSNIDLQSQTQALTRDRFRAGLVSELDVAQAGAVLESTRSTLPPLESRARALRNRLAVLLGAFPGVLEDQLSTVAGIPKAPAVLAVGIPADVIRRRPDIRRAERVLAAQTARIGMAEAELYPRLTLTGNLGLESDDVSALFGGRAAVFRWGPSISWNLFDRARVHRAVDARTEQQEQALLAYEKSVLLALEEVENALVSFVRNQERRTALSSAAEHSRRAVHLSRAQYREGLTSFQSVLDSQRQLFELEDLVVLNEGSITRDFVALYRALGGGWESRDIRITNPDGGSGSKAHP